MRAAIVIAACFLFCGATAQAEDRPAETPAVTHPDLWVAACRALNIRTSAMVQGLMSKHPTAEELTEGGGRLLDTLVQYSTVFDGLGCQYVMRRWLDEEEQTSGR